MKEICSITHHEQFMCKSSCAKVHDTFPGTSQELFMNSFWWLEMVIKSWILFHKDKSRTVHELLNVLHLSLKCSWTHFKDSSHTKVHEPPLRTSQELFMNSSWLAWNVHEIMNIISQGLPIIRTESSLAKTSFYSIGVLCVLFPW